MTKREMMRMAKDLGYYIATYSPGGMPVQYKFFRGTTPSEGNEIYVASGKREAIAFLRGLSSCSMSARYINDDRFEDPRD